ncbi:MAG: hypothetical protein ACNFW9_04930 [Candidatus Kerfeldbacteria bacterium]
MKLDQQQVKTKVSIEEKIVVAVMMGASLCLATGIIAGFFSSPITTVEQRIVKVTCAESKPLILEKPVVDSTDIKEMISSMNKVNTDLRAALAAGKNVSTIQSLIIIRKQLLSDLMQMDSSAALESVFTKAELDKVNTYATNCSEILTTYDGKVYINTFDNFEEGISKDSYTFVTDDDSSISLFPSVSPKYITTSRTIAQIVGYVLDDKLLFDGANNLAEKSSENLSGYRVTLEKSDKSVTGERKTIILKVDFANTSETSPEHETIGKVMDNINDYYVENSYDQLHFAGIANPTASADIYPTNPNSRYKIDLDVSCEVYISFYEQSMQEAYDADDSIDFTEYDHLVIIAPWRKSNGDSCTWAGMASIGSVDQDAITIPGTEPGDEYQIGRVTVRALDFPVAEGAVGYDYDFRKSAHYLGHELGHNLGNKHAAVLRCNTFTTPLSECVFAGGIDEALDLHDAMGYVTMSHYNALHKDATGWMNVIEIQTITNSGTYELYPIEIADRLKLKALKIPRGDNHYIYVEYRQPIGFDETSVTSSNLLTGALIHTTERSMGIDYPYSHKSFLLDLCDPPYGGCGGWYHGASKNVALQLNNSWTDLETGVVITPLSVSDDSVPMEERKLTVEVEFLCKVNKDCADDDWCTVDTCVGAGTADAYCESVPAVSSCGDRTCGFDSWAHCFACGDHEGLCVDAGDVCTDEGYCEQICEDGVLPGECNIPGDTGKICIDGELTETDCTDCGCPSDYQCDTVNRSCECAVNCDNPANDGHPCCPRPVYR